MIIDPSNLICPKCLKGGYVNYIGQSYKYIAKCYNCGFYFEKGTFLKEVSEKKTNNVTTNADRFFRNATNEQLAQYMDEIASCEFCPAKREKCGYGHGCIDAWLEWLKQEYDALQENELKG